MSDVLSQPDPGMEVVAITTARELVGSEADDKFGLLDCPMYVARALGEASTSYQVTFDRPPFSSEEFIDFYNRASPSDRWQSPEGIAGDWIIASPERTSPGLERMHEKIPAWSDMTSRGEPYVDIARNASKPYLGDRTDFEGWVRRLPEPRTYEEIKAEVGIGVTSDLARSLAAIRQTWLGEDETPASNAKLLERLATKPTKLLLKNLVQFGYKSAPETLRHLIEFENPDKYRKLRANDIIGRFAKLPFAERSLLQKQLISLLADETSELGEGMTRSLIEHYVEKRTGSTNYIRCIGRNGEAAYVVAPAAPFDRHSAAIPSDYRDLQTQPPQAVITNSGNHVYDVRAISAKITNTWATGKFQEGRLEFRSNVRKVRAVEVVPQVRWTNEAGNRTFDISWVDEQVNGELPTRRISDGVFGLVAVHYVSRDIALPETRSLPDSERDQDMGAAQMPLLALMFKKKIASGQLIKAAEQAVS